MQLDEGVGALRYFALPIWECYNSNRKSPLSDGNPLMSALTKRTDLSLDLFTVLSIGIISFILKNVIPEAVGHGGAFVIFTSAVASFGGSSAFAWMSHMLKTSWFPDVSQELVLIARNWTWVLLAVILALFHIFILGPDRKSVV